MPRAAVLSAPMMAFSVMPHSISKFRVQNTRAAPLQMPYISDSPEEKAMLCCVLDQPSRRHFPKNSKPPQVLRLVSMSPAQSESTST